MDDIKEPKPRAHVLEFAEKSEVEAGALLAPYQDAGDEYTATKRQNLLWKMDIRIIPALMVLYLLSFIDRANIGNTNIEGMSEDLHLSSAQYNTVLSIFLVTYVLCEVPSNYILERYFRNKPSLWIGIITVLCGVLMTLHGAVHNYDSILSVRLLMGVFEVGLFPGAVTLLTKWYTKYELATRLAVFYVGSALAGAFSGLLAFAIAKMNGVGGLEGWRWIFIIEGITTAVVGAITPWVLTDVPESCLKWLNDEEKDYLVRRMIMQNGGDKADEAGKHLKGSLLLYVVSDWQYYPLILVNWANGIPGYGLKFTPPRSSRTWASAAATLSCSVSRHISPVLSALSYSIRSRTGFVAWL